MVSANTLCKKLLNVKDAVIEDAKFYTDQEGVNHLRIHARTNKWHKDDCPFCHRRCPRYDQRIVHPRIWRGLDFGATLVEIEGWTHRIECPEHGVVTAYVPWAYPGSGFTAHSCQSGNCSVIIRILFQYYPDENYRRIRLPVDNTFDCLVSPSA